MTRPFPRLSLLIPVLAAVATTLAALPEGRASAQSGLPAGIVSVSGSVQAIAAPADIRFGAVASNSNAFVFAENRNVTLASPLDVNIKTPGTYPDQLSGGYSRMSTNCPCTVTGGISAETRVDSFLIHVNTDTGGQQTAMNVPQYTINFARPILGLIFEVRELNASAGTTMPTTPFLSNPPANYLPAQITQGLLGVTGMKLDTTNMESELGTSCVGPIQLDGLRPGNDCITWSGNSLTVTNRIALGTDHIRVIIESEPLPLPFALVNCTRTIGYWKTHAGGAPQKDEVTAQLPISLGATGGTKTVAVTTATQAVSILSMTGGASNGIVKLQAQLLAAKLNVKSGANGATIASTISAADAFLALKAAPDWNSLSNAEKRSVNDWMTVLDTYNNGGSGSAHCR